MITAIVRFPLPQGLSPEDVKSAYEHSAPQFRGAPGLIRKYYLHGADQTGGGVYFWQSRGQLRKFTLRLGARGLLSALVRRRTSNISIHP
jgi:hypothetical protein